MNSALRVFPDESECSGCQGDRQVQGLTCQLVIGLAYNRVLTLELKMTTAEKRSFIYVTQVLALVEDVIDQQPNLPDWPGASISLRINVSELVAMGHDNASVT